MSGNYGVKIKNYKAGSIYEYSLGVRNAYHCKNAMFSNSLFLMFLRENGLKEVNGTTRDIIGIDFEYGSKSYDKAKASIERCLKNANSEKDVDRLETKLETIDSLKDVYDEKSKDELRTKFYADGVDIEYLTYYKDGRLKKRDTIHYVMLYRSTGKAKDGSCVFINKRLYKKAIDFLYMGYKMPKTNAPIVEMSAYSSLICSTIVDTVNINPRNILILKDVDSYFKTKVVSVGIDENKHCICDTIDNYELKNTLFDGQCLIDEKVFPKMVKKANGKLEKNTGSILLRHHMMKSGGHLTYIQKFFKDYYGDNYETATIEDMFGITHYAKDIEMITTDNSMKWIKFGITYDEWCNKVNQNGNTFGIVKMPHKSKLGDVQRMSYQMVNALDIDIMENVVKDSKQYIELLKKDNHEFINFLIDNSNFSNDYEVLVALCKQNWEFTKSEYFRDRKRKIIEGYVSNFRFGKVIQNADNLVIVGSPYAMLLYSVGEDVEKDDTFETENDCIQCCTTRFDDGEMLAEFRSPFNSKNNMGCLHNVYSENIKKYFGFGDYTIAVNMIHTDFQDRNNGSDQDFDTLYVTNQIDVVNYAKHSYLNYPTIVNNIPKEKKSYDYSLENYAIVDNSLSKAQMAIGSSSNMAQLALTYTYNFNDKKYLDYTCILSVVAQCAIDNAKRKFDIDIVSEIDRIKKDLDIKENKYPIFWKHIKDKKAKIGEKRFDKNKINSDLKCPMNYLMELEFTNSRSTEHTLPMDYFFVKHEIDKDRRTCKKVEELIEQYSLCLYKEYQEEDDDDNLLLRSDFDDLINSISSIYISKNYLGLFSWLLDRAFNITNYQKAKQKNGITKTNLNNNRAILLKTLYTVNPDLLLKCFKNGSFYV